MAEIDNQIQTNNILISYIFKLKINQLYDFRSCIYDSTMMNYTISCQTMELFFRVCTIWMSSCVGGDEALVMATCNTILSGKFCVVVQ